MTTDIENNYIECIKNGEYDLYSYFVEQYQEKLYAFILRMVKNKDDAQDITQDTFIKAYQSLKSFKFKSKFSTWLFQIGYNNSINFIKKISRRTKIEKELPAHNPYLSHETELEKKELNQYIENILLTINEKFKATLHLYYFEEKSYKDIALILKIPINTVKSNIFRGKNEIKEKLTRYCNYSLTDLENIL